MRPQTINPSANSGSGFYVVAYKHWLAAQRMSANTERMYVSRVTQFLHFLNCQSEAANTIADATLMQSAMKRHLQFLREQGKSSNTLNANVNAFKSFCGFLKMQESVQLDRETTPVRCGYILNANEQEQFLEAVQAQSSARDRAIALILLSTGLRIGQCAALDVSNIGPFCRSIMLSQDIRISIDAKTAVALAHWLEERQSLPNIERQEALWLSDRGKRLSVSGIVCVLERIGWKAKLLINAEVLRRTSIASAVDALNHQQLLKRFGGYISKSTLKRYGLSLSLPPTARSL